MLLLIVLVVCGCLLTCGCLDIVGAFFNITDLLMVSRARCVVGYLNCGFWGCCACAGVVELFAFGFFSCVGYLVFMMRF